MAGSWPSTSGARAGAVWFRSQVVDDAIRAALTAQASAGRLREIAVSGGMRSLLQDGWRQVVAGVTTPEEVLRTGHV